MSKDGEWMDLYLARITGTEPPKKETRSDFLRAITVQKMAESPEENAFVVHAKTCKNGCNSNKPKAYCGSGRMILQIIELATQGKLVTKFE